MNKLFIFFVFLSISHLSAQNYNIVSYNNDGNAIIKKKGKYGVINKKNKKIIPIKYNDIQWASENFIIVTKEKKFKKKYGLFSSKGENIFPMKYSEIKYLFEDLISIKENEKYGVFNFDKQQILPSKYDGIYKFQNSIMVKQNILYRIYNSRGQDITSIIYDDIDLLSDDLLKVKKNNLYGLIDEQGNEIIPLEYDNIQKDENNILVISNELAGYIDLETKKIIPITSRNATFIKGDFRNYFRKVFIYPESTIGNNNIQGKVIVMFIIEVNGTVSNIKIMNNPEDDLAQEVIRVLKNTSGKWIPTIKDGKPIKSSFKLPINFVYPEG